MLLYISVFSLYRIFPCFFTVDFSLDTESSVIKYCKMKITNISLSSLSFQTNDFKKLFVERYLLNSTVTNIRLPVTL